MPKLDEKPQVAQLAKELGLEGRGDWLRKIQEYAHSKVRDILRSAPVAVLTLDGLFRVLADSLSVKVEYVRSDADLERIEAEYRFSLAEARKLRHDLNDERTDGLLMRNPDFRRGHREFLAVVDARGANASRAYFTAWHEITHLIVTPPQRAFQGVYRTGPVARAKDPEESVVDAVAGELAFYGPIVRPVVIEALENQDRLTFGIIEEIRQRVAPEASLYATGIAVVRLVEIPVSLIQVAPAYKKSEQRRLSSNQQELRLRLEMSEPQPKLRAVDVISSSSARDFGLAIFKNMRVPERSILTRVSDSDEDLELHAIEDQSWWEVGRDERLPPLPVAVSALRRGPFVYGLISPL